MALLKPKKVTLKDLDGNEHDFTLHRLPALLGREIAYQYIGANMPRMGDYKLSLELNAKLMAHVTKNIGEIDQPLNTPELIDNHTVDWELLSSLEDAMLDYNSSFLANGKDSIFSTICERSLMWLITQMSRELSGPSSDQETPPSTS